METIVSIKTITGNGGTNPLNHLLSDGMERVPEFPKHLSRQRGINTINSFKERPAELHPAFDDPRAIVTANPLYGSQDIRFRSG